MGYNQLSFDKDRNLNITLDSNSFEDNSSNPYPLLYNIFELINDSAFVFNLSKKIIVHVNSQFSNTFVFTKYEVVGKASCFNNLFLNENDAFKIYALLQQYNVLKDYQVVLKTKDNRSLNALLSAQMYQEGDNNFVVFVIKDNLERKNIETVLRTHQEHLNKVVIEKTAQIKKSEKRFRDLYDNALAALLSTDINEGIPIEVNNAAVKLFGYNSVNDFKDNFSKNHHFIEPNRQTLFKKLENSLYFETLHLSCLKNDGKKFWVDAELKLNKENKCIDWVLIDVTEKVNEITHNLKLSTAIEQSPECICITDKMGTIEYANKHFSELTGYSNDELLGSNPGVLNSGYHDKAFYDNLWNTILTGNVWKGEIYNKKKNGELFWEQGSIAPIFDENNEITHYVAVKEDITAKKQNLYELQVANDKIKESERLYRGLINNLDSGVIVHDKDGAIVMNNNRASELLGLSMDQLSGRKAHDPNWHLLHINNEKYAYEEYPLSIIKTTKKPVSNHLVGVERPATNDVVWLIVNGFPVLDKTGDIKEIVLSFTDFTKRKIAEDELIAAKEKAEENDRLKTAFLTNISHEIRTPMNGILGFISLLKDNELSGPEKREYIQLIEKSGERMLNTIHDIIDMSRIESGEVNFNFSKINLTEQLKHFYNLFYNEAVEKGIKLSCQNIMEDKELIINSDKAKLNFIITSLLKNAFKYTNEGRIDFGCSIEIKNNQNFLKLFVKDTGIGIPEDKHEQIFERFVQADSRTNRSYDGSGLGLSIAKAYTEMLEGHIYVDSEEGKGAVFYVTIPLETKTKNINQLDVIYSTFDEDIKSKDLKILVVDDEALVRKYFGVILKDVKKDILYAKTGKEAVEVYTSNPDIDLILMDVRMPEMNGFEAAKIIRELNKDVQIIIQSAFVELGENHEAIKAGANEFISKPVNKNKLMSVLEEIFVKKL